MATVAAVYSQQPCVRTPKEVLDSLFRSPDAPPRQKRRQRPVAKRVWASLISDKDSFIADVRAEMVRRDPRHRRTWVMVTDGERALQRRVGETLKGVTLVLDLLHVMEKLWKVAYVFHPEGSPEAEAFVYERAERILTGQVSQVVKGLRQMVTKRQLKGAKAKTLLDVAGYYYRNRERMRYDLYLGKGWPIASGSVDPNCRCSDPKRRHGPYYQLTWKQAGKTVTRRLSAEEARLYREWIANRRQLGRLVEQMQRLSRRAGEFMLGEMGRSLQGPVRPRTRRHSSTTSRD